MAEFDSEDFVWPEVRDMRPVDAARLLDDIERAASAANKRAELLKKRKGQAKATLNTVLEIYEQDAVDFTNSDGKRVRYTPYDFDVFNVADEEAFREWAAGESERYYDDTPRLRQEVFLDEMRRRHQDGEALPPGVVKWTDQRLSRSASTKRKA